MDSDPLSSRADPFDEMLAWVGFTDEDGARLRAALPLVEPHVGAIVERFYAAVLRSPEAKAVLEDEAQIARLKASMARFLVDMLRGPHDAAHWERRRRIGRAHVRVRLPQRFMFTGMCLLRLGLLDAIRASSLPADEAFALCGSVHRICDVELAVMVGTYTDERARRSEQLAALGALAAAVAHEVRNPLAGISGTIQVVQTTLSEGDGRRAALEKVQGQVLRLGALVEDLLSFARPLQAKVQPVEIGPIAAQAAGEAAAPERARVRGGGRALADPGLLAQVLVELVQNARQAGATDVLVDVEDGRIRVLDDGPGIPPEHRGRIFEPFFTTKTRGTGLGLHVAQKAVEAMDGALVPCSSPLGGAGFEVRLPAPKG